MPAPVPVQTLRSVVPARLPLAAEQLTPTQASQVEYLQLRLRQACMRKFGFGILLGLSRAYIAEGARITREFDSRWFGVSDPTAIAAFGYHVPAWTAGSASAGSGPLPPSSAPWHGTGPS